MKEAEEVTKEAIRKDWPLAVWFVGDPPPIGRRVLQVRTGFSATVIGAVSEGDLAHHCPTCSCVKSNPYSGWWVIRTDTAWNISGTDRVVNEFIEAPFALVPLDEPSP